MNDSRSCPFCQLPESRIVTRESGWLVIRDGFPVAPGHTLVISERHVGHVRDLTEAEAAALMGMVARVQEGLSAEHGAEDFTVGINDGAHAGQTVPHLHVHVIPRHVGDVTDPRGGVRWVIPQRAAYWSDD